ncbi:MAG TPA: hypothetical protein VEB20_08960, partial [Azospirillaceae bacterium]|nr:hypothetical protein [Azospirillaceae bacterium]
RLDSKVDGLDGDLREVKERLSAVEFGLAGVRRELAGLAETDARLQAGFDRLREDVGRIKRRLDLDDKPAAE